MENDPWGDAIRRERGQKSPFKQEQEQEQKKENMIFTIALVRMPSELEKEKGVGESIIAGPQSLTATDDKTALVQFGAANAEAIKPQPAGLTTVYIRQGI